MQITIVESYPGELAEKADAARDTVESAISESGHTCGCDNGCCSCGCGHMEKALTSSAKRKISAKTPVKPEETPFRLIKEVMALQHEAAEATQRAAIADIERFVRVRGYTKGDVQ
jgi:hypothetical protein